MPHQHTDQTPASTLDMREKIALSVAARMCGVDYDTFLRWVAKGVIPHVLVGPFNRKRVYREDVVAMIRDGK